MARAPSRCLLMPPLHQLFLSSLLLFLLLRPSHSQSGYVQDGFSWSQQFPTPSTTSFWPGRYGASSALTSSGNVALLGGLSIPLNATSTSSTPYTLYNDIQLSSSVGTTFVGTQIAAFTPRFFHASALTSAGSILLIGGFSLASGSASSISSLRDTWYSTDGLAWLAGSQMPWSRGRGAHDVDADLSSLIFYVTCGYTQDPGIIGQTLNDVWKTPDAGNTWQIATVNAPFQSRAFHAGLVRQGALYVVGGATYSSGTGWTPCNDVWVSYDQGTTWGAQLSTSDTSFLSRFLQSSLSYNNDDLFFMAGVSISPSFNLLNPLAGNPTVYSDVWESTDAAQTWQQTNPTSIFGPRFSAPALISGQDLLIMGGVNASGAFLQDVWMTVLPQDGSTSSGVVVAAIVGTLSGILMVVVVVIRRMQDRFIKGPLAHPQPPTPIFASAHSLTPLPRCLSITGGVVVSGRTEASLKAELASDSQKA
jgi:hypothetical protein